MLGEDRHISTRHWLLITHLTERAGRSAFRNQGGLTPRLIHYSSPKIWGRSNPEPNQNSSLFLLARGRKLILSAMFYLVWQLVLNVWNPRSDLDTRWLYWTFHETNHLCLNEISSVVFGFGNLRRKCTNYSFRLWWLSGHFLSPPRRALTVSRFEEKFLGMNN